MPDNLSGLRCPQCEYDLTGLREHRCPECGTEFDPAFLRSNEPPKRRFKKVAATVFCLAVGLLALQGGAVWWVDCVVAPRLRAKEMPVWSYEGDVVTQTALFVPCAAHPILAVVSLIVAMGAVSRKYAGAAALALGALVASALGTVLQLDLWERFID